MSGRSEQEWAVFIQEKIAEVNSALDAADLGEQLAPLGTVANASDPRFALSIDHTLLKPEATPDQIDKLCDEAIKYGFKSCCVNGIYVEQVAKRLAGTTTTIPCVVLGFPLGAGSASAKAEEARQAIADGAQEVDTVVPLGLLRSHPPQYGALYSHLRTIVDACGSIPLKVIIETSLLPTPELKIAACVVAAEAGAAFVKTSTGFNGGGATVEDVKLMRLATSYKAPAVKVKASGGVRSLEACIAMFKAGAERIGTSSGSSIMANVTAADAY